MEPAARRTSLREQLGRARAALDGGDLPEALAAVDRALEIDPDYLAAQALKERIVRQAAQPVTVAPAPRATASDPDALRPASASAAAPALAAGLLRFEERTRARRVEKRAEAARAALAGGRLGQARVAIAEIAAIDPEHPEYVLLLRELEARAVNAKRRWPVPAAVAALVIAGVAIGGWQYAGGAPMPALLVPAQQPAAPVLPTATAAARADVPLAPLAASSDNPTVEPESDAPAPAEMPPPPPEQMTAAVAPRVFSTGTSGPAPSTPAPEPRIATPEPVDVQTPLRPQPASTVVEEPVPQVSPIEPSDPAQLPGALASPQQDARVIPAAPVSAVVPASRAAAPVAVPPAPRVRDEDLVLRTLQQYRRAYDTLDARAAQAVWPAVDGGALQRAFDGLVSQRLTFQSCELHVTGASASADCRGTARYTPRVGSGEARDEPRNWQFTLRKTPNAEWQIESARVAR